MNIAKNPEQEPASRHFHPLVNPVTAMICAASLVVIICGSLLHFLRRSIIVGFAAIKISPEDDLIFWPYFLIFVKSISPYWMENFFCFFVTRKFLFPIRRILSFSCILLFLFI